MIIIHITVTNLVNRNLLSFFPLLSLFFAALRMNWDGKLNHFHFNYFPNPKRKIPKSITPHITPYRIILVLVPPFLHTHFAMQNVITDRDSVKTRRVTGEHSF